MERPYYKSTAPLGLWQAVCVLHRSFGDQTRRVLHVAPSEEPRVEVEHYRGPYDSLSATARFRVTPEAAAELKREGLVIGEPYWGGRSTWVFEVTEKLDEVYWETIAPKYQADVWR